MSIFVKENTINAKSFDLVFDNENFFTLGAIVVNLLDTNGDIVSPLDVEKTVFSSDLCTATVVLKDSTLLELGSSYRVTVSRTDKSDLITDFLYNQIISIESAELICHGTRFFTLNFEYPVNFTESINPTAPATDSPFFLLPAALDIGVPNGALVTKDLGFEWNYSADLKSVNIESRSRQANTGALKLLTNFPVSLTDDNVVTNWMKEFEVGNPTIPMIKSEGSVPKVSKEQTNVVSINALDLSKQEFIVKFDKGVLLLAQEFVSDPNDPTAPKVNGIKYKLTFSDGNTLIPTEVDTVVRPDINSPDELIFKLKAELPSGSYTVTLDSILDANGNPTKSFSTVLIIDSDPPNVQSANALLDGFNIELTYDQNVIAVDDIADPDYIFSALNPANYEITLVNGIPYFGTVIAVENIGASGTSTDFKLTLSDPLAFSEYKVTVSNVLSSGVRNNLDIDFAIFTYYDPLGPTVDIIGYDAIDDGTDPKTRTFADSAKVVIAKFTKPMKIGAVDGAADDYQNYGLDSHNSQVDGATFSFLEEGTVVTNVSTPTAEYADRFRLPLNPISSNFDAVLMSDLGIAVGYHERINNVYQDRYIDSISGGTVEVVSDGYKIEKWATPITLCKTDNNNAKMSLIIPNQIAYSIDSTTNANEFYSVDSSKLTFTFSDGIPTPEVINLAGDPVINGNEILFTFERDLNLDALTVTVTESVKGSITDIFGEPVLIYDDGCVFDLLRDKVKPIIKAASLVAIDDRNSETTNPIKVALFFNKRMKYTADDNFIAYDDVYNQLQVPTSRILSTSPEFINKKIPNPPFTSAYRYLPAEANLSIIEIDGEVSKFLNSSNANLKVQTNLDESQMDTEDVDGNIVEPPFTKDIINFKTKSFSIRLLNSESDSDKIDAEFKLSFDRTLNTDWFSKFNFGTPDAAGKYAFSAYLEASYIDVDGKSVPIPEGTVDPIPSNTLVTQTFKLYVDNGGGTISGLPYTDIVDENGDPIPDGGDYSQTTVGSSLIGNIANIDPTAQTCDFVYTISRFYAATLTIQYYTIKPTTPDVGATRVAEVSFSPDSKSFIMVIKEADTKEFLSTISVATTYCEPVPYVLMAGDDMVFVNVSYKAKSLKPIIEFTPPPTSSGTPDPAGP